MTAALMGTLAWADKTGGRLSADEKIALARNLASLRAEMVFDEARCLHMDERAFHHARPAAIGAVAQLPANP